MGAKVRKILKRLIIGSLLGFLLGLACVQAWMWIDVNATFDMVKGVLIAAPFTGWVLFVLFGYLNDQEKNRR